MQDYKKLEIYKEAVKLTLEIYALTRYFPEDELFGIISQLRRASVSISSNIAEGAGRMSNRDFVRFLYNSIGSLNEVENLLVIAKELNYLDETELKRNTAKIGSIRRMTCQFMKKLSETNRLPYTDYRLPNKT